MILANKISKSYGPNKVLDEVNIKIEPGRCSILIGPSGSGKSTLIKMLSLIDSPDSGTIQINTRIFDFPSVEKETINIWPEITVVFQQLFLWPHLTLKQNIELPLKFRDYDIDYFNKLIEQFDLLNLINRFPNQVSQGQRQRVAIVRALMLKPKYILFDEVTSALDNEQAEIILYQIEKLRTNEIGILLVTHQMSFVRSMLTRNSEDKFYFIDKGKLVETGMIDTFNNPKSFRLKHFLEPTKYSYEENIKE